MSRPLNTVATPLQQPIVEAVRDSIGHQTHTLTDDRVKVNAGPSTKNFEAVFVSKDWRTIPAEVVLLVMDLLPVEDVFRAGQVCRRWYNTALSNSCLWTHLEVRATWASGSDTVGGIDSLVYASSDSDESDEDYFDEDEYFTLSNLYFLNQLLPRAQTRPLTVTITVPHPEPSAAPFVDSLRHFLWLVAPQLEVLHIHSFCPRLVQRILRRRDWAFPLLRRLVCSDPNPDAASVARVDFQRIVCPALAHLDLGAFVEAAHLSAQPALTYLRAHVRRLDHVLPLLLIAPAVTRLGLAIRMYYLALGVGKAPMRAAVSAALNPLQEVSVRAQNDGDRARMYMGLRVDDVLAFFQELQCPRVVLELAESHAGWPLRPVLNDRWVDATQVVLRAAPDALEVVLTDATLRTLTIRLRDYGGRRQPLDWARVPTLNALTALRVDASVWCVAMRNFPRAPQLAETTLVVDGARGLDALMEYQVGAVERDARAKEMKSMIGRTHIGVHVDFDDRLMYGVPRVPRGSGLTLTSDEPVTITRWGVQDVKSCLGLIDVGLDGVSIPALYVR